MTSTRGAIGKVGSRIAGNRLRGAPKHGFLGLCVLMIERLFLSFYPDYGSNKEPVRFTWHSKRSFPWHIPAAALILVLLASVAFLRPSGPSSQVQVNELKVGDGTATSVQVDPSLPQSFQGLSVASLLDARRTMVAAHSELVSVYQPHTSIFETINPELPWFGATGYYFYGIGEHAASGPAVASSILLNPFSLVTPEFWGISIWDDGNLYWKSSASVLELATAGKLPLSPSLLRMHWEPSASKAEALYTVSSFLEAVAPFIEKPLTVNDLRFSLNSLNAADWGYQFIAVTSSENPDVSGSLDTVLPTAQTFGVDTNCGLDKGCNHISQPSEELANFRLKTLPGLVHVKLWKQQPAGAAEPADFTFVLKVS